MTLFIYEFKIAFLNFCGQLQRGLCFSLWRFLHRFISEFIHRWFIVTGIIRSEGKVTEYEPWSIYGPSLAVSLRWMKHSNEYRNRNTGNKFSPLLMVYRDCLTREHYVLRSKKTLKCGDSNKLLYSILLIITQSSLHISLCNYSSQQCGFFIFYFARIFFVHNCMILLFNIYICDSLYKTYNWFCYLYTYVIYHNKILWLE